MPGYYKKFPQTTNLQVFWCYIRTLGSYSYEVFGDSRFGRREQCFGSCYFLVSDTMVCAILHISSRRRPYNVVN